jgi:hypothetical protein
MNLWQNPSIASLLRCKGSHGWQIVRMTLFGIERKSLQNFLLHGNRRDGNLGKALDVV